MSQEKRYSSVTEHYDSLIDENNDPVHDPQPIHEYMSKWDGAIFIDMLQISPQQSVLEIGVGTGRLALKIASKCGELHGIDLSPKTIQRARDNLTGYPNIVLYCGDFLTYEFDQKFDLIYSSLTFLHIRDKQTAISKIADLLNPSGRFILSIDKNRQTEIDFGDRTIAIYPDHPDEIFFLFEKSGLLLEKQEETEFAWILAAKKA